MKKGAALFALCLISWSQLSGKGTMGKSLFGTDGIRKKVGTSPLTADELPRVGYAIARWACDTYGKNPTILLGHDTRISCSFIKAALKSGLLRLPVTIDDVEVLPTPAIAYLTEQEKYDCGIIISASHNPCQDNGIKIIDGKSGKLCKEDEVDLSTIYHQTQSLHDDYTTLGICAADTDAADRYLTAITPLFPANFLAGKKIVLDCANGATSVTAQRLFQQFGATTIMLAHQPNGTNINDNCGSLHPEQTQKAVLEHDADAGFAFDGDGDRITAVARNGQIKDGDDILAILLEHPAYKKMSTVVGTIMTNQGLEVHLNNRVKTLARTPVGDKHVSARLKEENLLLGGEPSGHIIARDFLSSGDGVFAALRLMETITQTGNWDMVSFKKYPQVLINVPTAVKKDLTTPPLADIIAASKKQLISGRLIVRYSGTENVLRVMVEDTDLEAAQAIGEHLAAQLKKELQ